MKIERIGENMIKITLSIDDLEERNIDLESLNYNSPAAQELFWDMMEQVEDQLGFNLSDSQFIIEPVPDLDEGFIITIARMDDDGDFESIQKYIKSKLKKSELKAKRRARRIYSTLLIYAFNNIEDLRQLSKNLSSIYTGESSLYKYGNTYYLVLLRSNFTVTDKRKFETLLSEFGSKISNVNFYEGYLSEYGSKLVENNALEVINNYF
ncbi:MAG TPA: adaptor protein MecA [Clostridiaceae bacterium]|nr:adaptor protein MecA [Clostridiaceae bacterium]